MQKLFQALFFFAVIVVALDLQAQNILVADNNVGAVAVPGQVFVGAAALQDAIDAAMEDDIIQVIRSTASYGAIVVSKRLNIFGIGLSPDTDGQSRSRTTTVDIADPVASGTRISGIWITSVLNLGGVAGTLDNLLIENSFVRRIQHNSGTTMNNIIIRGNVMGSGISSGDFLTIDLLLSGNTSNVVITNNVIYGTTKTQCCTNITNGLISADAIVLENNLLVHSTVNPAFPAFEVLTNSLVRNNIFYGLAPIVLSGGALSGNTFENNMSFNTNSDVFPSTGGNISINNQEGVSPMFSAVNQNNGIDFSVFDATFTGGTAIGNGTDGTDLGIGGGAIPFSLEGTLIPTIQSLEVPSMVIEGNSLNVRVQAKGN